MLASLVWRAEDQPHIRLLKTRQFSIQAVASIWAGLRDSVIRHQPSLGDISDHRLLSACGP